MTCLLVCNELEVLLSAYSSLALQVILYTVMAKAVSQCTKSNESWLYFLVFKACFFCGAMEFCGTYF